MKESSKKASWVAETLTDEEFLVAYQEKTLNSWSHACFIRVIWILLKKYGRIKGKDIVFSVIKENESEHFHLNR
eukprot:UN07700